MTEIHVFPIFFITFISVGWWYSGNCGLNNGVACRKVMGSDTPVTIPPTPKVDSYCPDGYFSAGNVTHMFYKNCLLL